MNKKYITLTDENGIDTLYEIIDEVSSDGKNYVAVVPVSTQYFVLRKENSGKKDELFISVEGKELEKIAGIFDQRLDVIDYDNE
ncbi:MAG: DUF1292 domain-containing protein [Clostridia bacterium]|nr:DUF1292 domain-containing protein [Clostridia bacterium]